MKKFRSKLLATVFSFALLVSLLPLSPAMGEVPEEEAELICPANSHFVNNGCFCDSGYVSVNEKCITEAQACAPFGPSHLVGTDCVCNDGYGVLPGSSKCVSLSAACAKYDALWSEAKGDCVCPAGKHEDTVSGKCVSDKPAETKPTVPPTPPVPEKTEPVTKPTPTPVTTEETAKPMIEEKKAAPTALPPPETETPKTTETEPLNPLAPVDELMEPQYQTLPPTTQAVIAENKQMLEKAVTQVHAPREDLLAILTADSQKPLIGEALAKSLVIAPTEALLDITAQQKVLESFADQGAAEIEIKGEEIVTKLHENFVKETFNEEIADWKRQYEEAKKTFKLKKDADKKELEDKIEMEKRLKWQIAELQKIVGYNHLRCLESTKVLQFDTMSKDYKEHFNGQAAENMFEEAAEGQAFDKAARNVSATTAQIKQLKDELKKQYPGNWQEKYYDLPEKPNLEKKLAQKENIFKVFEKLKK